MRRRLLFLVLCSAGLVACNDLPLPGDLAPPSANPSEPESPTSPEPEPPAQPDASVAPELKEVLRLVNEARINGTNCGGERFDKVAPLTLEPRLTKAAQKHSQDMFAAQTMTHDTPPGAIHYRAGSSPWERVQTEGYKLAAGGENIARGYSSAAAVMQGWLNSPGHCRTIMGEGFTEIGLGLKETFWTQVFASPK